MKPALLVICGPNGAGKTTITVRLRAERWSDGVEYLNADEVARDRFGDWNSPTAILSAAQWTDARREDLLLARQGIAFETVLSTSAKLILSNARRTWVTSFAAFDNSIDDEEARLCARTHDGRLRKIYRELPSWVDDTIATLPRHAEFVDLRAA